MTTPTADRDALAEYYVANSLCTDPEPCAECLSAGRAVINDVKVTARAEGRAEVAASVEAVCSDADARAGASFSRDFNGNVIVPFINPGDIRAAISDAGVDAQRGTE